MTNVQHMTAIVGLELRALWLVTQSCCIMMSWLPRMNVVPEALTLCLRVFVCVCCCRRVLVSVDTRASRLHVLCLLHSHSCIVTGENHANNLPHLGLGKQECCDKITSAVTTNCKNKTQNMLTLLYTCRLLVTKHQHQPRSTVQVHSCVGLPGHLYRDL